LLDERHALGQWIGYGRSMQYRIEISSSREGVARIVLPGRSLELEARGTAAAGWEVAVVDPEEPGSDEAQNTVALFASSANDAVWRVARAAVRAVSELTNSPLETELRHDPDIEPPPAP
jgi:hypothetical protein